MKKTALSLLGIIVVLTTVSGCGLSTSIPVTERRKITNDMESNTLQKLYQQDTATKKKIEKAVGYGVFANGNVNVILISAGSGYGVVVNNYTGQRTYMKMALGGVGLGLGAKDYRQVLIFNSKLLIIGALIDGYWFAGLLLGGAIGWIIGTNLQNKLSIAKGVKDSKNSTIENYPVIEKKLEEGWQFNRPSA